MSTATPQLGGMKEYSGNKGRKHAVSGPFVKVHLKAYQKEKLIWQGALWLLEVALQSLNLKQMEEIMKIFVVKMKRYVDFFSKIIN